MNSLTQVNTDFCVPATLSLVFGFSRFSLNFFFFVNDFTTFSISFVC